MQTIIYLSPVGTLLLAASEGALVLCDWADASNRPRPEIEKRLQKHGIQFPPFKGGPERVSSLLSQVSLQLDEYFQGKRKDFNLPLRFIGTPFQQKVWQSLLQIPYGETWTYKQQASFLGLPKAVRAVANANRLNALSILVPCHRVIGTCSRPLREGQGGSLTGYAGGLRAKQWLINHEKDK